MKIFDNPNIHLTYCLNIHPGETWEENFEAIRKYPVLIRDRIAPGRPFGLGLRLGVKAAERLSEKSAILALKTYLKKNELYVFTINGFPYGNFHNIPVKEMVYDPDWRTNERVNYTNSLSDILSAIMPEGVSGSISTVPGSFKEWIKSGSDRLKIIENLMRCVAYLAEIWERDGKEIHLGLEPEPGCLLETTEDIVNFFTGEQIETGRKYLALLTGCSESEAGEKILRHLGVCFDTCHMSLQFEDLANDISVLIKNKIRVSKIQISAALKTNPTKTSLNRLKEFCEPVYLHQTVMTDSQGHLRRYNDLPEALSDIGEGYSDNEELRIHFHVPIYFTGDNELQSTSGDLTPEFLKSILKSGCSHLEIETYTFNVLPCGLRARNLEKSISDEYSWVLKRIKDSLVS